LVYNIACLLGTVFAIFVITLFGAGNIGDHWVKVRWAYDLSQ
jgi:hypothetical protein